MPESEDVEVVVAKALAVQRGRAALSYIAGHDKLAASTELIERVMRDPSTISTAGNEADDNDGGMFGWYVGKMFERLDAIDGLQQVVASLEWIYFEALRHSERPPRALYRLLSEDPDFFVMLLKSLYGPSGGDEPELSGEALDRARTVATQAFHVLEEWTRIPGSDDDGRIDATKLAAWVKGARASAATAHRVEMADYRIGVILSAAHRTADEPWPPEPIRDVLEDVANDAIDEGFAIGRFNRRGVTTRMPNDGGGQERSLAAQYRADAKASSLLWPRTRAVLERMAKGWLRGRRAARGPERGATRLVIVHSATRTQVRPTGSRTAPDSVVRSWFPVPAWHAPTLLRDQDRPCVVARGDVLSDVPAQSAQVAFSGRFSSDQSSAGSSG